MSISNQDNALQTCLQAYLIEVISQLKFLSSGALVYVKLTKTRLAGLASGGGAFEGGCSLRIWGCLGLSASKVPLLSHCTRMTQTKVALTQNIPGQSSG